MSNFNREIESELEGLQKGRIVDGATGFVDWYGVTDGARSFDGTHYMFQVNMEKAMLFLNLVDAVWREAVEDGGLRSV